jgi:hypothetical protein
MSSSFDLDYATKGIKYTKKTFMKLSPVANFIKVFWINLCLYRHLSSSSDMDYATNCVNYTEKTFMKLSPGLPLQRLNQLEEVMPQWS